MQENSSPKKVNLQYNGEIYLKRTVITGGGISEREMLPRQLVFKPFTAFPLTSPPQTLPQGPWLPAQVWP